MKNLGFPTNKRLALPVALTFLFFAGGYVVAGTISLLYCVLWIVCSLATGRSTTHNSTNPPPRPSDGRIGLSRTF